jgi:hypothetical protein
MFAYCGNNPICRADNGGCFFFTVLGATVGATFGALDALIQGKDGDDFTAMVVAGASSGAISGAAADVLSFTGASVGIAVGVMATVGAVGSLVGSAYELLTTGDKKIDTNEAYGMVGTMISDAILSGFFAYIGGPVPSLKGKISAKGFWSVARNFYAKQINDILPNIAEEALATVTGGLAKFTASAYRRAFEYTAELWSE